MLFTFDLILDFRGKHSLLLAVAHGHLHIVKFLIENGANLHIVDKYNRSCVHWAAMHKYFDIVKLLLESGNSYHFYSFSTGIWLDFSN